MSALGQKQTCAVHQPMSAFPSVSTLKADIALKGPWSSGQQQRSLTMYEETILTFPESFRVPWNKDKLIGAKPPLRQKHVWAIRSMLQNERNKRDLAMFNLAIDSKLRGCDVVAIKVEDVAPSGRAKRRRWRSFAMTQRVAGARRNRGRGGASRRLRIGAVERWPVEARLGDA